MVLINLAAFGVLDTEGLHRADNDAGVLCKIVWSDVGEIADVENAHPSGECIVERGPIGMARIAKRQGGLLADDIGSDQPQDHGKFPRQACITRQRDRMGGEDGLPTAGRQPNAAIGRIAQSGRRPIRSDKTAQALLKRRLVLQRRLAERPFEGLGGACFLGPTQKVGQDLERRLLVGLQLHQRRAFTS